MENKSTVEELLRQQLEILAERSQRVSEDYLPQLTEVMVKIFKALKEN